MENRSLAQLAHTVLEQHGRRPVHDLVYDARDGHHAADQRADARHRARDRGAVLLGEADLSG